MSIPKSVLRKNRGDQVQAEADAYYGKATPESLLRDAEICTCGHRRDVHALGLCDCGCGNFTKETQNRYTMRTDRQFRQCEPCDRSIPVNTGWHRHVDGMEIHVWPVWDAKGHNTDSIDCDCKPLVDIIDCSHTRVVHNAWDGRKNPYKYRIGLDPSPDESDTTAYVKVQDGKIIAEQKKNEKI